ncbi:MAG: hypothetical protein AAB602_02530 [Patescibacteria group bacterium]
MNLKKILMGSAFFFFALMGIGVSAAHAKECSLNQSKFEALSSADDSQDYHQKIQKELILRKDLISNTLACAIEEASALKTDVDKLGSAGPERIWFKISSLLENSIEYYKLQLTKVPNLGLEGSRYFSKDLLVWRRGNYVPIAKTASNFIVWSENQNLFRAAQNRLDQISGAVTILKLIENESIQVKWNKASSIFRAALTENQNAKRGLENLDSPEETLTSIKLSLESLSETYKILYDLVVEINELTSKIQQSKER